MAFIFNRLEHMLRPLIVFGAREGTSSLERAKEVRFYVQRGHRQQLGPNQRTLTGKDILMPPQAGQCERLARSVQHWRRLR